MSNVDLHLGDCLDVLRDKIADNSVDTIISDPPYALHFLGQDWDKVLPHKEVWKECLRVAKPGAIMMLFGGTRTFHRLVCDIEDVGWQIKDCIVWAYGQGFPKSLNISKAFDKKAGVKRKVVGKYRLGGTAAIKLKGGGHGNTGLRGEIEEIREFYEITAPATDDAKLWDGYGSTMKPSIEIISVAMKPLDGTYIQNAKKHGVAGYNIDGSRVSSNDGEQGRWPANLIHDGSEDIMGLFAKAGSSKSTKVSSVNDRKVKFYKEGGLIGRTSPENTYSDTGTPARFFYCAKPSKKERGEYNTHTTVKPIALMEYLCKLTQTPTGGVVLDHFMGSGTTGVACTNLGRDFIGIEQSKESFEIAQRRVRESRKLF